MSGLQKKQLNPYFGVIKWVSESKRQFWKMYFYFWDFRVDWIAVVF